MISTIRAVAARAAAGSPAFRSGWLARARRRQAALTAADEAPGLDAQDDVGIALLHASSLAVAPPGAGSRARRLTGPDGAGVPLARVQVPPSGRRRDRSPPCPLALAYRFSQVYRARAGFPHRRPPAFTPADFGLAFETTIVRSPGRRPAGLVHPGRRRRSRARGSCSSTAGTRRATGCWPTSSSCTPPGFHCLTFDVRGNGANPAETLPVSGGEFGADALAGFATLIARPEVTIGAILGHSMGAIGALLAAAADPRVAAVVASSTPSDPRRLVSETFRLAGLRLPAPIAGPLSWLTTREFLRQRGHRVRRHQRPGGDRAPIAARSCSSTASSIG